MKYRMHDAGGRRSTFDETRSFGPPRGAYDPDRGYGEALEPGVEPPPVFGVRETGVGYRNQPRPDPRSEGRYWDGYEFGASGSPMTGWEPADRSEAAVRYARTYSGHRAGPYARPGRGPDERGFWDQMSDEAASWFGDSYARERREADHRGRGPKGYRRSDARISEDVHDHLTEDRHLDASDIEVLVKDGEVTLNGVVRQRQDKHRAEHLVEQVLGVDHVQNNLRVAPTVAAQESSILHDQAAGHTGGRH